MLHQFQMSFYGHVHLSIPVCTVEILDVTFPVFGEHDFCDERPGALNQNDKNVQA